jgi:hypothetical protein
MDPRDFIDTIYLGDEGGMSVLIDSSKSEVKLQVTCIHRVRSEEWNFYTAEDLISGFVVFEGVKELSFHEFGSSFFNPECLLHLDYMESIEVKLLDVEKQAFEFVIKINVLFSIEKTSQIEIRMVGRSIALEPFDQPGHRIRN